MLDWLIYRFARLVARALRAALWLAKRLLIISGFLVLIAAVWLWHYYSLARAGFRAAYPQARRGAPCVRTTPNDAP